MFWCDHSQKFHLQLKKETKKKEKYKINKRKIKDLNFLKLIYGYFFNINSAPAQIQNF